MAGKPSPLQVWSHRGAAVYCFERHGRYWMDIPGVANFGFVAPTESVTAVPHPPGRPELIRVTYERSVVPLVLQEGGTATSERTDFPSSSLTSTSSCTTLWNTNSRRARL